MEKIRWTSFSPGVWIADFGEKPVTLTEYSGMKPSAELRRFKECGLPAEPEIERAGRFLVLRVPIRSGEHFFGGGLRFHSTECRHATFRLRADHYQGSDNGRTHAPVPFFAGTGGYGIFLDSPRPVTCCAGSAQRRSDKPSIRERDRATDPAWGCFNPPEFLEMSAECESLRIVLFAGDLKECVSKFNLYCGGGCLPPKWALGFWHRCGMSMTESDVLNLAEEYRKRDFPLSVLGLEPGWQSNSYPCTYEWSEKNFPRHAEFLGKLKKDGIRVNLWENPYVSEKSELYRELEGRSASHLVWCGIVPDYTLPDVRETIKKHHVKHHFSAGVSGYKLDESDGSDSWLWPDHTVFPSGTDAESCRNLWGLLFQRMTFEIYRERNLRTFGMSRSGNAGCSGFPYVLYNDRYDFKEYLTGLCSCGFTGNLWTPEVRSARTAKEFLRRIQLAALSPLTVLNAWADDFTLWTFPEIEKPLRAALKLRESLLPYLYSAFARYRFEGLPPFRSVFLDYGYSLPKDGDRGKLDSTANPYRTAAGCDITDQYILGDFLMAAPAGPEDSERQVMFPPGKWYDFHTGELVSEGGMRTFPVTDDSPVPLFAPDGAVVPVMEDGKMRVLHFGEKPGTFTLYDDDGETFAFEKKGEYSGTILRRPE